MFPICYFSNSLLYIIKEGNVVYPTVAGRRNISDEGEQAADLLKMDLGIYVCLFFKFFKWGVREGTTSVLSITDP